jgi:integrase
MNARIYFIKARRRWRLEYFVNGRRFRPSFRSKEKAEAELAMKRAEVQSAGDVWVAMLPAERADLLLVLAEMKRAGVSPRAFWERFKGSTAVAVAEMALGAAFDQFMQEKEAQRLSDSALSAYRSNVGRFVRGRAALPVAQVSRDMVLAWLAPFADNTFNSYLTSLNTFFIWCAQLGWLAKAPTATIKKIERRRMENAGAAPRIFTFDELKRLLAVTVALDPGLIRYVAVCTFAGLRPEREAAHLRPEDIGEQIHVRGKTAKDRQERYVEILPVLAAWLAVPQFADGQHGPHVGDYPIKNLRRRFERVRLAAGLVAKNDAGELVGWVQDTMRHTFASISLVLNGAEKTKAALGHGDYDMLFGHYRKAMSRAEAEKFTTLQPALALRDVK